MKPMLSDFHFLFLETIDSGYCGYYMRIAWFLLLFNNKGSKKTNLGIKIFF
jgi:hypothetical protein